jgi:hypothetical protein
MKPATNGRPRKWKRCPDCTRRLLIADDFYHWNDSRDGNERMSRVCKPCTRRRARKRYARVMADPYLASRERALSAERHRRSFESGKNAERCRRYRDRMKREDPARYQRTLEDARIRSRLAKSNGDVPPRTVVRPFAEALELKLKPDPLVEFLRALSPEDLPTDDTSDARKVYSLLHANPQRVSVSVADRIVTRCGGALATVYPELYA